MMARGTTLSSLSFLLLFLLIRQWLFRFHDNCIIWSIWISSEMSWQLWNNLSCHWKTIFSLELKIGFLTKLFIRNFSLFSSLDLRRLIGILGSSSHKIIFSLSYYDFSSITDYFSTSVLKNRRCPWILILTEKWRFWLYHILKVNLWLQKWRLQLRLRDSLIQIYWWLLLFWRNDHIIIGVNNTSLRRLPRSHYRLTNSDNLLSTFGRFFFSIDLICLRCLLLAHHLSIWCLLIGMFINRLRDSPKLGLKLLLGDNSRFVDLHYSFISFRLTFIILY